MLACATVRCRRGGLHTYIYITCIHTYTHTCIHTCIDPSIHPSIHTYTHTYPPGVQTLGKVTCVELPAANYDFAQWCSARAQNKASAASDMPLNSECMALIQLPDLYTLLADMLAADPARRPSARECLERLGPEWSQGLKEKRCSHCRFFSHNIHFNMTFSTNIHFGKSHKIIGTRSGVRSLSFGGRILSGRLQKKETARGGQGAERVAEVAVAVTFRVVGLGRCGRVGRHWMWARCVWSSGRMGR
jgi:hypothetical protein